jgi:rhodanese-related sulfurtransferase
MSRGKLFVAVVLGIAACSRSTPEPEPTPAQVATPSKAPETARTLIAEGAVVLDVRTPEEFTADHLKQATNIPIEEFAQRIAEVDQLTGGDKTRPLVVYCASGKRSSKAKQQLEAAGYVRVVNGGSIDEVR